MRPCPEEGEEPEVQRRGQEGAAQQWAARRPQGRAEGETRAQLAWLRLNYPSLETRREDRYRPQ